MSAIDRAGFGAVEMAAVAAECDQIDHGTIRDYRVRRRNETR
jgi:hypothetical protein